MKRLALLGASGHGKVVADIALLTGWCEVDFYDDAWPQKQTNGRWSVIGDTAALKQNLGQYDGVLVSIGDCSVRWEKHQLLRDLGAPIVSLIHPDASLSQFATVGKGSVLMAGSVMSADASIGEANIINTCASVDHDCALADAVHICPGVHLCGGVQIGRCTWVGAGATVKQGMVVGGHAVIGAGAIVVQVVPEGQTVVGNPARLLARQER